MAPAIYWKAPLRGIRVDRPDAVAAAWDKGDPDSGAIIRQTLPDLVEEFLPR